MSVFVARDTYSLNYTKKMKVNMCGHYVDLIAINCYENTCKAIDITFKNWTFICFTLVKSTE